MTGPATADVRRVAVSADGTRLAVVERGPVGARPFVVAHGVGSSARFVGAAFAGPVLDAGGRLVTFDQRGHGDSSPVRVPGGHVLDRHVEDLTAVVAGLASPPAVVIGVSLGGHAAVRAAARGHLEGTTVVACLPAWTGDAVAGEGPHAAIATEVRSTSVQALIARLAADTTMPSWLRSTLLTDYRRHDPDSLAAALVALDGGEAPGLDEVAAVGDRLGVVGWPHDPGHPLDQARRWAAVSGGRLRTLRLTDLEDDLERLGRVALAAAGRDAGPRG
ncbi:alpha/beta fold hydrolase [Egicoccus halophilus]|uniref:alpha/beta fold hydrolase n=1 Tax=Egicoccus halophilus TaxID=1670830 RepID=UPI0013EE414A|nr:alpha/beta hydrolase [Egicoccus halophilus]